MTSSIAKGHPLALLALLMACGQTQDIVITDICDDFVDVVVAGPSTPTPLGFSADEAAAALGFDGDALVT